MRWACGIVVVLSAMSTSEGALAGGCAPLCRVFDIGDARSLAWGDDWWRGRADYNVARLISDTETLLAATTPVIVRLETTRRASIYASGDRQVAEQLFTRLLERARATERTGRPDALAYLDVAYLATGLTQISEYELPQLREQSRRLQGLVRDRDIDAYALVQRSLSLRPGDPELEYAAALIASVRKEHHSLSAEHARRARAGAAGHALLLRNLRYISGP
jgi:hypothetical protein